MNFDYTVFESKNIPYITITAKSEDSLDLLSNELNKIFEVSELDPSSGILANARQYNAVFSSYKCIEEASDALKMGMTLDAVTVSLEGAISELLALTGERVSETVVDNVFSHFCVGK